MLLDKTKWTATLNKVIEKTKAKPSSGVACAVASVKYIADGLCDDIGQADEDAKAICTTIRECLGELAKQLQQSEQDLYGFASNASAAAKAAGHKTAPSVMSEFEID
jgi:hypothetical protein